MTHKKFRTSYRFNLPDIPTLIGYWHSLHCLTGYRGFNYPNRHSLYQQGKDVDEKSSYHTTKTIFGKDQRMPATGYISYRPWARHSRIISGSAWVFFMSMHAYIRAFSTSRADTLMYFRATEACLNKLFCLFLCLLSARFVGSKSSHFAV